MYDTIESVFTGEFKADNLGEARMILKKFFKMDKEAIEATIEDYGLKSNRSKGFRDGFYAFLKDGTRTEVEVMDFIENGPETSPNVVKDKGFHLAVWKLVEDVRNDVAIDLAA